MEALFAKCQRPTLRKWLEDAEAWLISYTLEKTLGHRTEAARALGIARRTLYKKMEKLGIDPSRDRGKASRSRSCAAAPAPATAPSVRQRRNAPRKAGARSASHGRRHR
jgi:hypothetical protein